MNTQKHCIFDFVGVNMFRIDLKITLKVYYIGFFGRLNLSQRENLTKFIPPSPQKRNGLYISFPEPFW